MMQMHILGLKKTIFIATFFFCCDYVLVMGKKETRLV